MTEHLAETELPAHTTALHNAVHDLVGTTSSTIERDNGTHEIVFGVSIYTQLAEYVAGAQGTRNGNPARSMPPVVLDAVDLIHEIDQNTGAWQPHIFDTPERLWALADQEWRPQDVQDMHAMTRLITAWTVKARELLDPPRRWTLPAPCPACGERTVYRRDSAGESVRQPALQISEHGCTCQACRYTWTPDLFAHLARTIGTLPDNVLE